MANLKNFGTPPLGNYASFNINGELRLYGEATQWEDLRVSANATRKGGSNEEYVKY